METLFPKYCLICGKPGKSICDYCSKKFIPSLPECYICRRLSKGYKTHECCKNPFSLESVFWGWQYNNISSQLIKTFKYKESFDMQDDIGNIFAERISHTTFLNEFKNPLLVPIPVHRKREKERGFNQSLLICEYLSKYFSIEYSSNLLFRKIYGNSQAKKNLDKRRKMQENTFFFDFYKYKKELRNKEIILIDDVITTGTTLDMAGKSIKIYSKDAKISALCLFRGKPHYSLSDSSD